MPLLQSIPGLVKDMPDCLFTLGPDVRPCHRDTVLRGTAIGIWSPDRVLGTGEYNDVFTISRRNGSCRSIKLCHAAISIRIQVMVSSPGLLFSPQRNPTEKWEYMAQNFRIDPDGDVGPHMLFAAAVGFEARHSAKRIARELIKHGD